MIAFIILAIIILLLVIISASLAQASISLSKQNKLLLNENEIKDSHILKLQYMLLKSSIINRQTAKPKNNEKSQIS